MILAQSVIERILDAASNGGVDFAEIFCEDTRKNTINVRNSGVSGSSTGRESGVGIRIFSGLNCYYAYSNDSREESLIRLTKELVSICKGSVIQRAPLSKMVNFDHDMITKPFEQTSYQQKIQLVDRVIRAGMDFDPEISQMNVRYLDQDRQILIANSEGFFGCDRQRKTRMLITAYAQNGSLVRSGYYGPGAMKGLEFYDEIDLEACAHRAAQAAKTAVHADKCPGGMMTVVVDSGFGGLMFHEACGHSLEASSVAKGNSEFSGKLGQQVASPLVTLIDDGSMKGEWGSVHMDDEGNLGQRNVLIENGILKGYMIDRLEGRRMGMAATGSARRQSYKFAPEARMTNTFIAAGTSTREEIISNTEKGLFVGNINGGSVNPATGDFNFNTSETWLIENGKLTRPVYGATLIGNGGQVLKQVDMVGNNLCLGQGYCYNTSGALFINAGQPTLRVKNILVGGLG